MGKPGTGNTKKIGITMIENHDGGLVSARVQNGWRVCIDYGKLDASTRKTIFLFHLLIKCLDV